MLNPSKRLAKIWLVSLLVGLAGLGLDYFKYLPLQRLESFTRDLRTVYGRKTPVADDLVLLTIDEASLRLDGLMEDEIETVPEFAAMRKGWPWSRSVHAAILEKLIQAGARVVAFDLLFPSSGPGDAEFAAALQRHAGRVLIGGTFVGTDTGTPGFSRPSETLLVPGEGDRSIGFTNFVPDADGTVRAAILRASPEDFVERPRAKDQAVFASLAAGMLRNIDPERTFPIAMNLPFRFSGPPETYVPHPVYEIFIPEFWRRNYQNGAFFKDKIVVVGPEGGWSHDEHPTPFVATLGSRGLMSGPEVHLQAFAAARSGEFIHVADWLVSAGLILAAAALARALNGISSTPRWRLVAWVAIFPGYWFCAQVLFDERGLVIPIAAPLLVLSAALLCGILLDFSQERVERLRVRATLERYVSGHVANEILDKPQSYLTTLVGVRKEVTVLFADLRNFTAMVNMLNAQDLVAQLNEYYARVIEDVFNHGGTLDKIMGDGMMAVWGNLRSDGVRQDAIQAVQAALSIQQSLTSLNARWAAEGRPELGLGIGIAHGDCVVGNIGSERKMDLTVIGDAANLAARLQALSREKLENILIDGEVARLVGESFSVPLISLETIRGFEQVVEVHSVEIGGNTPSDCRPAVVGEPKDFSPA